MNLFFSNDIFVFIFFKCLNTSETLQYLSGLSYFFAQKRLEALEFLFFENEQKIAVLATFFFSTFQALVFLSLFSFYISIFIFSLHYFMS